MTCHHPPQALQRLHQWGSPHPGFRPFRMMGLNQAWWRTALIPVLESRGRLVYASHTAHVHVVYRPAPLENPNTPPTVRALVVHISISCVCMCAHMPCHSTYMSEDNC